MKTARIFKSGHSQAVRLPKDFRFENDEVFIKKEGNAVVLLPIRDSWGSLFKSLRKFSEDFMSVREQPETQRREEVFDEVHA